MAARLQDELNDAFTGDNAPGKALFELEVDAAKAWAEIAGPIVNDPRFQRWGLEAGAVLVPHGNQWSYSRPFVGLHRGGSVALTQAATGYLESLPRIHTHPSETTFSGMNISVSSAGEIVGSSHRGDLFNAWRHGRNSYVVLPSGRVDAFSYQSAHAAQGARRLGDFVRKLP